MIGIVPTRRSRRRVGTLAGVLGMAVGTIGAIALAGASPADAAPATHQVVVRPVTSGGHAVHGWKVVTESRSVSCSGPSAGAVSKDIAYCGTSADYTVACWHSADRARVLCLPDPTKRRLESVTLDGSFPTVDAPRHPAPQSLRTTAGGYYLVRDGGAGPMLRHHSTWVAQYFGTNGRFIAGPRGSDGVNRRHAAWFVTTFRTPDQRGTRQDVAVAYYVGTAR